VTRRPAASAPTTATVSIGQRIDKWLWCARVLKTRTQASALVTEGKVRVNRDRVTKPSHLVRPGDVLTIALFSRVRVLEVVSHADRRGDASQARALFRDLTPEPGPDVAARVRDPSPAVAARPPGAGRPTKRDRRRTDRLHEPLGDDPD
jgi:ribosome-associated heat shock protein Hsp15